MGVWRLNGIVSALARADTYGVLHVRDENFSVSDPSGSGRIENGLDNALHGIVLRDHLKAYLGQEVHVNGSSTVDFHMSVLPAESLDFLVMPFTPREDNASRTLSKTLGRMMISIFFMTLGS